MSARKPIRGARSKISTRLPYVEETKGAGGQTYLYYRRAGLRIPLPGPEHSAAYLAAYDAAKVQCTAPRRLPNGHTVNAAITTYLASADFGQLSPASRVEYRRVLDKFRNALGGQLLGTFGEVEIEALRDKYAGDPIGWNSLRSRMISVVAHYRRQNPGLLPANAWQTSRRLKVPPSNAHRPWPADVLLAVMRAATPEFRALLTGYLLTAQRGGDVTTLDRGQYDAAAHTLAIVQSKTGEEIRLHVPASLARALDAMAGRHESRLFVTPRGLAWNTTNAAETLRNVLRSLKLPRYTLHGLRATGPVALKLLGFENRAIRALTGHTSDANLETYLRGVEHFPLAQEAQEALEKRFAGLLESAEKEGNRRRASGQTGRPKGKTAVGNSALPTDCQQPEKDMEKKGKT